MHLFSITFLHFYSFNHNLNRLIIHSFTHQTTPYNKHYTTNMQPWIFKSFNPPHNRRETKKKHPHNPYSANPRLLSIFIASVAAILLLMYGLHRTLLDPKNFCSTTTPALPFTAEAAIIASELDTTASPLVAILHYATARRVPQQSIGEIRKPYDVLQYLAPCNFLVFGLGHDSLMWDSFNPRGTTLFLEEDPKWTLSALQRYPILRAHTVSYSTRVSESDALLSSYKKKCWGGGAGGDGLLLKGNQRCPLALRELPDEVYDRDWDVIMIDGPRGYFAKAPGRMAVIYSAAVMARARKRSGVTHVFLHDVDRKIEQEYAKEFLCMKYRVGAIRKLWHFVIPPAFDESDTTQGFC